MLLPRFSRLALVWWNGWGDVLAAMDTERFQYAIALREAGRVDEALEELTTLRKANTDPDEEASLLLNETRCYRLLGRLTEAKEVLSRAMREAPRDQLWLYLWEEEAILYWHEGERDKALKILERLRADYRELLLTSEHRALRERVQASQGMLLTELGRYRQAKGILRECLSFSPANIDRAGVLHDLGMCFDQLRDRERAKEMFQALLGESQRADLAVTAHYRLGTIYYEEGAYAKALMELEWCLANAKEDEVAKLHIFGWLARTAQRLGLKEEAERYHKLAVKTGRGRDGHC